MHHQSTKEEQQTRWGGGRNLTLLFVAFVKYLATLILKK